MTKSLFILILGVIGLLGGFFYTAPPIKLGYRCVGECVIALLFGLLPVFGSYYLQTGKIDILPLLPAAVVGVLIFLIILINEFPDLAADASVNKKTLIVSLGVPASVWIYRIVLISGFIFAAAMLIYRSMFFAGPVPRQPINYHFTHSRLFGTYHRLYYYRLDISLSRCLLILY